MRKLTSRAFRKCVTYWACEVLNGSYRPSKTDESEKTGPSSKLRGVTKKRHGHNFQFWALSRNQRGTNHIGPTLIPWQSSKLKIVAVSFFCDASSPLNFFFNFHSTLTANNSGLKPSKLKNYHIFGILRTSAFRWAIGKVAGVNIVRSAASRKFLPEGHQKMPKNVFFCFRPNYSSFWTGMTYPG